MARAMWAPQRGTIVTLTLEGLLGRVACADRAQVLGHDARPKTQEAKCKGCKQPFDTKRGRYTLCAKCRPIF